DAAVDAVLPGEPQHALAVEGRGVEVGVGEILGQRIELDRLGGRVDAGDGVLSAVGDPGGAVGADADAVRRRLLAERELPGLPALRIEHADRALRLRGVPDRAVGRRRDVMGWAPRGTGK